MKNLRKVAKVHYVFLTTPLIIVYITQLINTKPVIKTKLKESLGGLKKFKVQTVLVLDCKKTNNHKIFPSSTKLIASDSDICEAFKSMHQNIMTKIKNYACEDGMVLNAIITHSIKIFGR